MEAVDLFMCSLKIGAVIIDGFINYNSETKLKDTSLTIGDAYYSEVFEGQKDYIVAHKGSYISRFQLNGRMTYLKHCDVFAEEEIKRITDLCVHYTGLYTEVNEHIKDVIENMPSAKESQKDGN